LHVVAGRLGWIDPTGDGVHAVWRPRGADAVQQTIGAAGHQLSGPETDRRDLPILVVQLIEAGLARPDPYGLGMEARRRARLLRLMASPPRDCSGSDHRARRPLGDRLVADIRSQAEQVAIAVLAAAPVGGVRRAMIGEPQPPKPRFLGTEN
jgi:uncharacterized NAD(P)/FAD-binding protein YdhS